MNIDPDKKYAIFHAPYIAIPVDKVANFIDEAIIVTKEYSSIERIVQHSVMEIQTMDATIISGEQIIADSTAHRMTKDRL